MIKVVLLSGGLDSSVLLSKVVNESSKDDCVYALSIYYGQKHKKELQYARKQANFHNVVWEVRNLSAIFDKMKTPLLGIGDIPMKSYAEQLHEAPGIVQTYVPFRNGVLLSTAAAYAFSLSLGKGPAVVYYAAHLDDSVGDAYPDCSAGFVKAMHLAIYEGTGGKVSLEAPFVSKGINKASIVKEGYLLGVKFKDTWSCYKGGKKPCGTCGTCIDRRKAFEVNGYIPQ